MSFQEEYRLITESVGTKKLPASVLSLSGKDVLDFIQRLSTNDVLTVKEGTSELTILVSDKAKIIDCITLLNRGNDYLLIPESGDANKVHLWLDKFLFTEDVQMLNISSEYEHWIVVGKDVPEWLKSKFNIEIQDQPKLFTSTIVDEKNCIIYKDLLWNDNVFHLLIERNEGKILLNDTIADVGLETLRIENSVPKYGYELTEQVNPLEAGLERFISWTKGCYIGQEVIARIDTYKKLQRKLTSFIIEGNAQSIKPGKIVSNSEEVGWTTSHTWSPKLQKHIALGYLKLHALTETLQFKNDDIESVAITIKEDFTKPFYCHSESPVSSG